MSLTLTARDEAMLAGAHGEAAALAMRIMTRMAEVYGAQELLDITHAHIDSTIYIGDATLDFAERLASLGARVAVPTSLNVSGVDEHGWKAWPVSPDWASKAHRQMVAYRSMGADQTWTCAPYQTHARPTFGQQIAWGESNAIAFANSVIGARTERYPDLFDICCAITGRAPAAGLHLTEHRAGEILVRLVDVPAALQDDEAFWPVLGALLGEIAADRVPVVEGLRSTPSDDRLKAVAATAASTGRVALFHLVGITPEAPTLDAAFQGRAPIEVVEVTVERLRDARHRLTSAEGRALDLVVFGSPHFSLAEFRELAALAAGRRRHPDVRVLVTTSRLMRDLADGAGLLEPLRAFGVELTVDTCILATPMLPAGVRTLMTNSGKYAYYAPGLLGTTVAFGTLRDCVTSAVHGRVEVDDSLWSERVPC